MKPMIAILFMIAAGYFLIFGAGNLAERALTAAAGLALILSVLPGLIASVGVWVGGGGLDAPAWLADLFVVLALAGVGLFAWRVRDLLARRHEARARAWGTPRERATPPPPRASSHDAEAP